PIFSKSRRGQTDAVSAAISTRRPFDRDTTIIKVEAEFHDHVRMSKRKEKPEVISSTGPIFRFDNGCYFRFCVYIVLSLEYDACRKPKVLKQDNTCQHRCSQLAPRVYLVPRQRRKPTNVQY